MRLKMRASVAVLALFGWCGLCHAASAETTGGAMQRPAHAKPTRKHAKPAHAATQSTPASGEGPAGQPSTGNTIPMDFSGMERRGVDLKSPSEEKAHPDEPGRQPFLRDGGGISPGMRFQF